MSKLRSKITAAREFLDALAEKAESGKRKAETIQSEKPAPRLSVAEIMGRIQLAASKGDFETAKTLQAMLG